MIVRLRFFVVFVFVRLTRVQEKRKEERERGKREGEKAKKRESFFVVGFCCFLLYKKARGGGRDSSLAWLFAAFGGCRCVE